MTSPPRKGVCQDVRDINNPAVSKTPWTAMLRAEPTGQCEHSQIIVAPVSHVERKDPHPKVHWTGDWCTWCEIFSIWKLEEPGRLH